MTSVFYDVISLETVRGSSNVPIEGNFWWFWGIWTPKCCRPTCGPQKGTSLRHNACFEPLCAKIHAQVTSVDESGKEIKKRPYISRILPGALLRPIGTNFGLHVRLVDVINCAKFYRNRLRGLDLCQWFGFCEGSKFYHSHWIAMSPLTLLGTNVPAVISIRFCYCCSCYVNDVTSPCFRWQVRGMNELRDFLQGTVGRYLYDFWLDCELYKDTVDNDNDGHSRRLRSRRFRWVGEWCMCDPGTYRAAVRRADH